MSEELGSLIDDFKAKFHGLVEKELERIREQERALEPKIKSIKEFEIIRSDFEKAKQELILKEQLIIKQAQANRERTAQLDEKQRQIDEEKQRISRILN